MHLFTMNKLGGSVEILMMMKRPRKLPIIMKYFHFITSPYFEVLVFSATKASLSLYLSSLQSEESSIKSIRN